AQARRMSLAVADRRPGHTDRDQDEHDARGDDLVRREAAGGGEVGDRGGHGRAPLAKDGPRTWRAAGRGARRSFIELCITIWCHVKPRDIIRRMGEHREGDLTIDGLAARAGMTVRTVRSHITRRLLPPPRLVGRTAYYGDEHVARLELIATLQRE